MLAVFQSIRETAMMNRIIYRGTDSPQEIMSLKDYKLSIVHTKTENVVTFT